MAATSEELAAQSEELQTSIAFFKVDTSAARPAVQKAVSKPQPHSAKSFAAPAHRAPVQNTVSQQQARLKGFALDLNHGGPDGGDADFRESA
jgi:methyl-accepting chemotaxis protein